MTLTRRLPLLALSLAAAAGAPAFGQAPATRAQIDAEYKQAVARADAQRLERLAALAATQSGGEAELTYLEAFRFAIATDRYREAEPAAARALKDRVGGPETQTLATLVKMLGEADRGDLDGSFRDLKAFLETVPAGAVADGTAATQARLTMGEAYFRRLVHAGRFDIARQACDLLASRTTDAAVRDHFATVRKRLDLVGKPAPPIAGKDADGQPVSLASMKGKVVLVVFWASWCPPCLEKLPALADVYSRHEKDGFAVLGVNLDDGADRARTVQRFVIDHGVPWPNVLSGAADDVAAAYGVKEIPASVLIGRDGTVTTLDLSDADLETAVAAALGKGR